MNYKLFSVKDLLSILMAATIFVACDVKTDETPVYELEVVAVPGTPVILTPAQAVGSFKSAEITANGVKGTAIVLDSARYIKYTPSPEFKIGSDHLTIEALDGNGVKKTVNVAITIKNEDDCIAGGVSEFAQVKQGRQLLIEILANDVFCKNHSNVSTIAGREAVLSAPTANAYESLSLNMFGHGQATVTYQAPNNITGTIELIYEIGMDPKGVYVDDDGFLIPTSFDFYVLALVTIEIVE